VEKLLQQLVVVAVAVAVNQTLMVKEHQEVQVVAQVQM
jgi:hypothetical protein|tara:strand:+ start:301 stop:414 length:114 start_codon:yes stop_codon:yes gene_type:complete